MENNLKNYSSIEGFAESEVVINKSRFIGRAYPVETEEQIEQIIRDTRKEHYKATHVCSAYILALEPLKQKASDDGEPSGTAGRPILNVLEQNDLKNVLVIVIRYFGGIKLGKGGLVRAYSETASEAIKNAIPVKIEENSLIEAEIEYPFYQGLLLELKKHNLKPIKEEFSDIVKLKFQVPIKFSEWLTNFIEDFTNGNCIIENLGTSLIETRLSEGEIII